MANIASGLNKRGHRELYDSNYSKAVECFFKAHIMDPDDSELLMDLIYAFNQNADYVRALEYCYTLLGMDNVKNKDMLYFFTAEAFGGVGCIEGCAQMLERCLDENPNGSASQEAIAFLQDLREKYSIEKYDASGNEVSMGISNGMSEAPFLNIETYEAVGKICNAAQNGDINGAIKLAENEISNGNFTVAILNIALMLGYESNNARYMKECVERFRFIEDYTLTEIRTLAVNLSEIGDNDIAYSIFRELYSKESGEKDIAFGFAMACEKAGEKKHAEEILKEIASSCGGIGVAQHFLSEYEEHSYLFAYEGACKNRIQASISDNSFKNDPCALYEAFDYIKFSDSQTADLLMKSTEPEDILGEINLRRLSVNPEVNLFFRAKAASRLFDSGKQNIYLNTGSDIVKFSPEINSVISKFFERTVNNEGTD